MIRTVAVTEIPLSFPQFIHGSYHDVDDAGAGGSSGGATGSEGVWWWRGRGARRLFRLRVSMVAAGESYTSDNTIHTRYSPTVCSMFCRCRVFLYLVVMVLAHARRT
jgi:hypothetical protein